MCPEDTSPEAWQAYLEVLRRMTPAERLQLALDWSADLWKVAEAGVRQRFPHADEREIHLRFSRLMLGEDLFRQAYGDVVLDEPTR
jgi:hypothetical protein